jgi:TRAP transporter TAXI family solute receptor
MKKIFVKLFIFILCLSACSQGPNKQKLKVDVTFKLNKFKSELFEINFLQRRGSYTYNDNGERLLIYFKTELKLLKDYKFLDWNSLGSESLINLLGATEAGVKGILADGNKKGDLITIYGGSNYKMDKSKWLSIHSLTTNSSNLSVKQPGEFVSDIEAHNDLDRNNSPSYLKYLARLKHLSVDIQKNPKNLEYFQNGLQRLLVNAEIKADIGKGIYGIGSGQRGGEYSRFGETVQSSFKSDKNYKSYTTFGSMHNIELVANGELDFGIAQGDTLIDKIKKRKNIRALMSLFPEAVQVIVLAESSLNSVVDLKNQIVNIGPIGSGSRKNAIKLLGAHGIDELSITAQGYSVVDALTKLKNKDITAIIFTGAYPFKPVQDFAKVVKIRLLKIKDEAINQLLRTQIKLSLPKSIYTGVELAYQTVGTAAVLFTSSKVDSQKVTTLLSDFYSNQETMIETYARAGIFSRKKYRSGVKIPFHPAAKKFFK